MKTISNTDNIIDSRDIIERIDELTGAFQALVGDIEAAETDEAKQDYTEVNFDETHELKALLALADEAECSPDWLYGETLIHEDYFTDYIEELINDCYELPKEFNSGDWPWRHMTIDYEAAADEAKQDYMEVNFDGATYYIRG